MADPVTILEKLKKANADAKVTGAIQDIHLIPASSTAAVKTGIDRVSAPMGIFGDVFDSDSFSPSDILKKIQEENAKKYEAHQSAEILRLVCRSPENKTLSMRKIKTADGSETQEHTDDKQSFK
jgi:hypothetical protein